MNQNIWVYIYIENICVRLPMGPVIGHIEGPKGCRDSALAVKIDDPNNASSIHQRSVDGIGQGSLQPQTQMTKCIGRSVDEPMLLVLSVDARL